MICAFLLASIERIFMDFYGFNKEWAEVAVSKYREYFSDIGIFENLLYARIPNMLETLRNNGKMIILATSKPTIYAEKILKHFSINNAFSFVSGRELDGSCSKKSEVIEYALRQNNITALNSVVMVGDREHDIWGASQTGVHSIGVLYGYGSRDELARAGATKLVDSVDELLKTLLMIEFNL